MLPENIQGKHPLRVMEGLLILALLHCPISEFFSSTISPYFLSTVSVPPKTPGIWHKCISGQKEDSRDQKITTVLKQKLGVKRVVCSSIFKQCIHSLEFKNNKIRSYSKATKYPGT